VQKEGEGGWARELKPPSPQPAEDREGRGLIGTYQILKKHSVSNILYTNRSSLSFLLAYVVK